MEREIIITRDGSSTIHIKEWNETYHSKFGAIDEAKHVFIKNGLNLLEDMGDVSILEIGFGTGLNAFITFLESENKNQRINYVGVEAYPLEEREIDMLNYSEQLGVPEKKLFFKRLHDFEWGIKERIDTHFELTKRKQFFQEIEDKECFDLIYFDAFGFRVQPELWSESIFKRMYDALKPDGILVTYACRTIIKKAMQEVGFFVEKLPGAPGKREMLRGKKR